MSGGEARARQRWFAATDDGWELELWRHLPSREGGELRRMPVLIVPGYAQTPYLFDVHPRGPSLIATLLTAGFETWTVYLRGTGQSRRRSPTAGGISLAGYVDQDLPAALATVLEQGTTGASQVLAVGSSLGGSIVYGHLARAGAARVAGVVALGSPFLWEPPHPVVRALFSSRKLAEAVPMNGASRLAMRMLPPLARLGWAAPYVNPEHVNMDDVRSLIGGIADPSPELNGEIAEWMSRRDFQLEGVAVAPALERITVPLLIVVANRDGLVSRAAACSVTDWWGGSDVEVLEVGTHDDWFSHADLFVAATAPERVFAPVARWLTTRARRDAGSAPSIV